MNRRRQYIVDKKYQFRTTFSVIGIVTLLTALVIIAIAANVASNNNKISGIIKGEDQIFQAMAAISSEQTKDSGYKSAIGNMSKDHIKNFNTTNNVIRNNNVLLISLLIFIVIQGIILFIMMIQKTHRISGPIYVMSRYIREMIDGKTPNPRPLRKHDELTEFYELFKQLVAKVSERKTKKPATKSTKKTVKKKK